MWPAGYGHCRIDAIVLDIRLGLDTCFLDFLPQLRFA